MEQTMTCFGPRSPQALTILGPADIGRRPWVAVPDCPGVRAKELWRFGDAIDALIDYAPGASTPGQPHLTAHHHIWVLSGEATVAGQRVVAGSYVYVPRGVAHRVAEVGAGGCTLLQLHRPSALHAAEADLVPR